ncbi:MAG: hypothetical protein AAGG68_23745 [Bacteroidota bacterium]
MPAKQQYLSTKGQRALKVSAGILGGFLLANALHLVVGSLLENKAVVVITSAYSIFFFWILFMILAFTFKNGWKVWGIYLLGIAICSGIIFLVK